MRDYIHVMDLAEGHLAALKYCGSDSDSIDNSSNKTSNGKSQYSVFNLGTGNGVSVLDMVSAMERASGKVLKVVMAPRRAGDISACYADPSKAREVRVCIFPLLLKSFSIIREKFQKKREWNRIEFRFF